MTSRPRLITSIPFWILLVGSLAATVAGGWIALTKVTTMVAGLTAQNATTADVYGGQSWIVIGGALLGAGLIGLVATLALAVLRALVAPAPDVEVVEPLAFADDGDDAAVPEDAALPAEDAASEPRGSIPASPASEDRTQATPVR